MQSPNTGLNWTFCADGGSLTYQEGAQSGVLESGPDVWWNIHRTYSSETNNVYDFTNAQQRAEHIQVSSPWSIGRRPWVSLESR